jgi:hypothetical protein
MTQDCELEQDYHAFGNGPAFNRSLPNILFCEVINAMALKGQAGLNSDLWRRVRRNDHDRFHVLDVVPADCDAIGAGIAALGMDFKRYFTVPTEEVYRRLQLGEFQRRCYLVGQYRDNLSNRFFGFLMRVALPDQLQAAPAPTAGPAALAAGPQAVADAAPAAPAAPAGDDAPAS